jgi:DNA-binding MarR family transcriptional regulator
MTQTLMNKDEDWLLLDKQLCFPLYAASRLVTRLYQPFLEPLGLTYPQYIVLMILWEDAPCSVSHICNRALLNTNTLTPLLKRLEKDGFVVRTRSKSDERAVEITLTEKGAAVKTQCQNLPQELFKNMCLTNEKFKILKQTLDEMINDLKAR